MLRKLFRMTTLICSLLFPLVASADIYRENFQDGVADDWEPQLAEQWQVGGNPKRNLSYRASDFGNDTVMISTYAADYKNVDYRVSLKNNGSYAAYVIFRASPDFYRKSGINQGSGYAFGISAECDGVLPSGYNLFKLKDGVYTNIQPWTVSEHLNCDTKGNRIRVVARGKTLKFFVNNKLVFKYRDKDALDAGRVGLMGYTAPPFDTTHSFDRIVIKDLAIDKKED